MPKLISRISGGLGNQLFIYATAKALAMRTGAELVLDTQTGFRRDIYQRRFALQCFGFQYKEANAQERFDFPSGRIIRYVLRRANHYLPFQRRCYLVEKSGQKRWFMPELLSYQPFTNTWLEGYWQSPLYFEDIRDLLIQELTVKSQLSPETLRVAGQILSANSVCVHLRLSRNVVNGAAITTDKQLNWSYFIRCMDFVAQQIKNPRFFCFSDNPEAAELVRSLPYDTVLVAHNNGDNRAFEDFYLMSLCRHFILSNSTFGWWPAWLCQYPDSMVVSPPLRFWDNRDILPPNWLNADQIYEQISDAAF